MSESLSVKNDKLSLLICSNSNSGKMKGACRKIKCVLSLEHRSQTDSKLLLYSGSFDNELTK